MTSHKITDRTGRVLAELVRKSRRIEANYSQPNTVDWPHLFPVKLTEDIPPRTIDGSDVTPGSGAAILHRFNRGSDLMEELGEIVVFSLGSETIKAGQWRNAIQDSLGSHWIINSPTQAFVRFTLNAAISATNQTVAATVISDSSGEQAAAATINVTSGIPYTADIGTPGIAVKIADGQYLILELMQASGSGGGSGGCRLFEAVLNNRPISGSDPLFTWGAHNSNGTAYIQSGSIIALDDGAIPSITSLPNPFKLNGQYSEPCLFGYYAATDTYKLLAVYQQHAEIWFSLDVARPAGLQQSIAATSIGWSGCGTGATTVHDLMNVAINAQSGAIGRAIWYSPESKWVILECIHRATNGFGTASAAFAPTDATVTISSPTGNDGAVTTTITAYNDLKKSGASGDFCYFVWNNTANRYVLVEVQCDVTVPAI